MPVKLLSPGTIDHVEKAALISTKNSIFLTAPIADSVANKEVLPINDATPAKAQFSAALLIFYFISRVDLVFAPSCRWLTTAVPSCSEALCVTMLSDLKPAERSTDGLLSASTGRFNHVNPEAHELEAGLHEGCLEQ